MKKFLWVFFPVLVFLQKAEAQGCETSFYFTENSEIVIDKFDKTGNRAGKDVARITDVKRTGNVLSSQYNLTKYDANGTIKEKGSATVTCENGNLKIGFQVPEMDGEKPKEASFSYPGDMKPGMALEATMEMQIKGIKDGKKIDVYFKVENRRVDAKEKVVTPMGSFDAFKISYDMNVRFKMLGIPIPMTLKIFEWYSPGMGVLKTEAYNKDQVVEETTVVHSIKK